MREIKFRVWNTETNKMIINVKEMGVFALQSIYSIDEFLVIPTDEKYPLMQYTGLKDKNGVEIYEGDIVKTKNSLYKVIYDKCCFWGIDEMGKYPIHQIKHYVMEDEIFEVIGNIYENPELFKED